MKLVVLVIIHKRLRILNILIMKDNLSCSLVLITLSLGGQYGGLDSETFLT